MTLGEVIVELAPINNRFRTSEGIERLLALWEMGDIIQRAAAGSLDSLLWEIQARSFITRDVLRYAAIVRTAWPHTGLLRELFGGVKHYSLFREALPFLKGDRAGINEATYQQVLGLIAMTDIATAKAQIQQLKKEWIGRNHSKGKSKEKVVQQIVLVREFIEKTNHALGGSPHALATQLRQQLQGETQLMSRVCYALAVGGEIPDKAVEGLGECHDPLVTNLLTVARASREQRSAFVKGVGANILVGLADLLSSLESDSAFEHWRQRDHIALRIGGKRNE